MRQHPPGVQTHHELSPVGATATMSASSKRKTTRSFSKGVIFLISFSIFLIIINQLSVSSDATVHYFENQDGIYSSVAHMIAATDDRYDSYDREVENEEEDDQVDAQNDETDNENEEENDNGDDFGDDDDHDDDREGKEEDDDDGAGGGSDAGKDNKTESGEAKTQKAENSGMNILILYPDDWRHDSIGSEKPYVLTPFLNQLAKEGIRFTHNAVTTSICWMSRATLWMGQYSSRHKSYKLRCPRMVLPQNWEHSWVKILQNTGYFVGHIGKWQYWNGNTNSLFHWTKRFEGHHWENYLGGKVLHASELAKKYALNFFDERPKDKPFVLSIAFYPPKAVGGGTEPGEQFSPTNETKKLYENVTIPRPEYEQSFQKLPKFLQGGEARARYTQRYVTEEHFQASMRNYYALITGVDQACKEIVDRLKQEGLYNNTMIIFTTDNGMFHGAHGLAGKWFPYQESIRVPLIIYDPRMPSDKVGTIDDSFTLNVDLAQTILSAAGVKPDELMQGRDISDLYLPNNKTDIHNSESVTAQPWREEFFYEFPSPDESSIPSSTALVRKDWKYIYWPKHKWEQLFNLENDPLENNDLYHNDDAKAILEEMRKRHDELREELHDPLYKNDPQCTSFFDDYKDVLV